MVSHPKESYFQTLLFIFFFFHFLKSTATPEGPGQGKINSDEK